MKTLLDLIKAKNKTKIIGLGVVSIVLIGIGLSAITSSAKKTKQPQEQSIIRSNTVAKESDQNAFKEKINGALSIIDKRLSLVQTEMEKTAFKNKTDMSSKALKDLSQTVVSFKNEAQKSLIKSHEENEALAKKIQALQEVIASLKGGNKNVQYLDKKALPFDVLAIDSVNEDPVLALRYNYNHLALEKGDKLAGWKVIALDYAKQQVEFDDENGAHVRLSLSDKNDEVQSWA
jgi:ABC-type Na+ efflux pump permease subunit